MAQTNVSSCVLSILASFSSGTDVFKKFRKSQKKRKDRPKRNEQLESREVLLARSLKQGPEDIGREYRKSLRDLGDQFAVGDGIAQTALAEILLRLNTGIVSIINTFLRKDKHEAQINYEALTELSERSRTDTCRTLQALSSRMLSMRLPAPPVRIEGQQPGVLPPNPKTQQPKRAKSRHTATSKHSKARGPILAKVVVNSAPVPSQVAMVRPAKRKNKSSSTLSLPTKTEASARKAKSPPLPATTSQLTLAQPVRPAGQRSQTAPGNPKPRSKHSSLDMRSSNVQSKADQLRATRSAPRLETITDIPTGVAPQSPNLNPYPVIPPRRRKATPTYYSTATASTRLGEIPLHKWAEPYNFDAMSTLNRQAVREGWPLTEYPHVEARKKRRGFFGLFRRSSNDS